MANTRNYRELEDHDSVVRASVGSYSTLRSQGFEVTINPGSDKNRYVGGDDNPRYPDVIVWKPEYPGATRGTAIIIEEIETENSVSYTEGEQWKDFGALGIKFLLSVPRGKEYAAKQIIDYMGVRVDELWTYTFNTTTGKYDFQKTNLI
jgi:hypothetical protein